MALQIISLLICVMLLIIALCILSYLKIIFERILEKKDDDSKGGEPNQDLELSTDDRLTNIISLLDRLISEIKDKDDRTQTWVESLRKEISSSKSKKPITNQVVIPVSEDDVKKNGNVSIQLSNSERIAYEDSTTAFQKVNNELYSIRKHKNITHELFNLMFGGSGDLDLALLNELSNSDREMIVSILGKIKIFNENYRPSLNRGLASFGLSFESCVRFPLNQPFDNSWDENILGYDVEDGTIIKRVVSLGYEFPESPIIGRQKTKVM
ncbi:MAG: hypothetical protein NC453_18860 [Muribaculum sp.]|nr:hypothetical protein [Muribaculum sp.]